MIDEELGPWITEADVCSRLHTNVHNVRQMALDGKLRPFRDDHTELLIHDGGWAVENPNGSLASGVGPATANLVSDCIYRKSDVEAFKKRYGQIQEPLAPVPVHSMKKAKSRSSVDREHSIFLAKQFIDQHQTKKKPYMLLDAVTYIKPKLAKKTWQPRTIKEWINQYFPDEARQPGRPKNKK